LESRADFPCSSLFPLIVAPLEYSFPRLQDKVFEVPVGAYSNAMTAFAEDQIESEREVGLDVSSRTGDEDDDVEGWNGSRAIWVAEVVLHGNGVVAGKVGELFLQVTMKDARSEDER